MSRWDGCIIFASLLPISVESRALLHLLRWKSVTAHFSSSVVYSITRPPWHVSSPCRFLQFSPSSPANTSHGPIHSSIQSGTSPWSPLGLSTWHTSSHSASGSFYKMTPSSSVAFCCLNIKSHPKALMIRDSSYWWSPTSCWHTSRSADTQNCAMLPRSSKSWLRLSPWPWLCRSLEIKGHLWGLSDASSTLLPSPKPHEGTCTLLQETAKN